MRALARNAHAKNDEWLGIDIAVDRVAEQLAELIRIDVRGVELRFREVGTRAGVIVAMRPDVDLRPGHLARQESYRQAGNEHTAGPVQPVH